MVVAIFDYGITGHWYLYRVLAKYVPYVEKVCYAETKKEQDNVEPGAGCITSLEKEFSLCSRDIQNSCTLDGCKLFGVDLQMHSYSGEQLNSVFKMVVNYSSFCSWINYFIIPLSSF
ncbi:lysine-specific demethylase JMJ14 isoform X1 [Spatholobus suberectus]|nr:lysine-specific demethylase JMJ14 isoform X1 [Spatholobus suberectus]